MLYKLLLEPGCSRTPSWFSLTGCGSGVRWEVSSLVAFERGCLHQKSGRRTVRFVVNGKVALACSTTDSARHGFGYGVSGKWFERKFARSRELHQLIEAVCAKMSSVSLIMCFF